MKMSVHLPKFIVEAEYESTQFDTRSTRLYPKGISSHAFKRAWNEGFTGKDVRIAILDTGIDSNHPDLRGKVINSINLTGEGLSESHGTHVAGTIAGNGWIIGGSPDAALIDIKVLGRNGGTIDNIVKAISLAVANGASVINLSLGSKDLVSQDIQKLTNAINDAWNKGTICIAAAGNDGTSVCTPDPYEYPASVPKVESIAACDVGENLDTISLASFSNENNMIDLGACGSNVVSTIMDGKYAIYSGTSMATPHVSAMAAILTQYIRNKYPNLKGSTFSSALASLIHSNVLKIQNCGIKSSVTVKGNPLVVHSLDTACTNLLTSSSPLLQSTYTNISFGLGFLRYQPNNGPALPGGNPYYFNGIFLGHEVSG